MVQYSRLGVSRGPDYPTFDRNRDISIGDAKFHTPAKIRAEQKKGIPWPFPAKISYNVSLTNNRAPGVCFVPVFRV